MRLNKKYIIILAIVVFMIVAIITITNQQKPLPVYTGNDVMTTAETESSLSIETSRYSDPDIGFTVSIPTDWQSVNNGQQSFIHRESGSSVQLQKMDYYPQITSVNATDLSTEMTASGYSLMNFHWADNCSYMTLYQTINDDPVDYIEFTTFDRTTIVRMIVSVYDRYYTQLSETIQYILDSFTWDKSDSIPAAFSLAYNETDHFEYPIATNWSSGLADGAFYSSDPVTGASYSITVTESNASYDNVTELGYVGFVSPGRDNFILKSFVSGNNTVTATALYMANGTQMMLRQYMIATGQFEYCITEECPADTYEQVSEMLDQIITLFRIF